MSELNFFAVLADHAEVVELLVDRYQARFYLDAGSTPDVPVFDRKEDILASIENAQEDPRFHVVSAAWQAEPLRITEFRHDDGRVSFSIGTRDGGPSLDYLARRPRADANRGHIVASWVSDHSWYRSTTRPGSVIRRPPSMAQAYKDVQRLVARRGVRSDVVEVRRPGPWVLPGALAAANGGAWLRIGEWHHTPRSTMQKKG